MIALALAACGSESDSDGDAASGGGGSSRRLDRVVPGSAVEVTITFWPQGREGDSQEATLTCEPTTGTIRIPRPRARLSWPTRPRSSRCRPIRPAR